MLAANQENAGGLPPGINAIKRELDDLERHRNDLLEAIKTLEQRGKNEAPPPPVNPAVYRHLPMSGAVAFYLETHNGTAHIKTMANELTALGVVLTTSPDIRTGEHNLKIMLGQKKYKKLFHYDEKTGIVTLKPPPPARRR